MRGKTIFAVGVLVLPLLAYSGRIGSSPAHQPSIGRVESVLALRPLIDMPEGIAINSQGHIFVGNRRLENDTRVAEILEIGRDGATSIFATLDPAVVDDFAFGVLGLAFNSRDELHAVVASGNPDTHGVWRIRRGAVAERLAGSDQMIIPNAITFDARGNAYVTDSADGTIWRFPRNGPGKLWIRHPLLAPDPNFGIGANGIAFIPPRGLFVANTDLGLIARIRIGQDGRPGEPEVVAAGIELLTVDGLAADTNGHLHAVVAAASAFGTSPLVEIDPDTGEIKSSTTQSSAFDFPTSLALGRGPLDHKSIYVINAGLYPEGRPEAAPGVVKVTVGVPGAPLSSIQAVTTDGPGQLGFLGGLDFHGVLEGDRVISIPVRRFGGSQGAVSVTYLAVGDTAHAGSDFAASSGVLTWADGESGDKMAEIRILDDLAVEGNEDFTAQVHNPTGGATIALLAGFQLMRIVDNDAGFGMDDSVASTGEADGSIILSVLRIGPAAGAVSVNYATASGSADAGSDFTSASGTLNWADGDVEPKEIAVSITNDAADESGENFTVSLSNPSAGMAFASNSTTVTIVDDDTSSSGGGGGGGGSGSGGGGGAFDYAALLFLVGLSYLSRRRTVCRVVPISR